ncbi:beta-amylase 7-like isoform X1 [Tanacetum coccineum]
MSYASDLTAGYYNTPENDLCDQILEMLKKHNVGFYHTLGDTDDDSGDTNDDSFASKLVNRACELSPILGENALPYSGKEGFEFVIRKAKHGPYSTFVDNELSPNMKESQQFREFQEFVTEMHYKLHYISLKCNLFQQSMDSAKITRKQSKQDKHEHGNGKSTKESEISSKRFENQVPMWQKKTSPKLPIS